MAIHTADKVEPPKTERHERTVYDEETTGKFLILLEKEPLRYKTMVLLALSTGFRRGELFGLQWQHIDFETGTIKIEQASQYLPGKGIFLKDPKNNSSKRSVTITASIVALLKQCKAEQSAKRLKLGGTHKTGGKWAGAEEPEADFLFTTWDGKAAQPDSINSWLNKFIVRTGLPHLTPHDFRHMAATYLITSGVDLRTVAGKLGHTSSNTTQSTYSHLLKSAEKETANKLETFLEQATEKAKSAQKKQIQ